MLEREIEAAVCAYAKSRGFLTYKFSSPNHIGVPDRMFLAPYQQAFWIEFKREGGTATPVQERECLKIRNCGFEVYLIDNVEDGKEVIDNHFEMAEMSKVAYAMGKLFVEAQRQDESDHETKH